MKFTSVTSHHPGRYKASGSSPSTSSGAPLTRPALVSSTCVALGAFEMDCGDDPVVGCGQQERISMCWKENAPHAKAKARPTVDVGSMWWRGKDTHSFRHACIRAHAYHGQVERLCEESRRSRRF